MSEATLDRSEVAKVRRLVETLGLGNAAKLLQIHPQTINLILAGKKPRFSTVTLLRSSLPKVKA